MKLRARIVCCFWLLLPCLSAVAQFSLFNAEDPNTMSQPGMKAAEAIFPDAFSHPSRDFMRAQISGAISGVTNMRQQNAQLSEQFADLRKKFWQSYPDGPTHAQDAQNLSQALFGKDIYYLVLGSMPEAHQTFFKITTGDIDNGISEAALPEFVDWVRKVRTQFDNSNVDLGNLAGNELDAFANSADYYQRYVVARDWAELDAGQKTIPVPAYTFMLVQRYPRAKGQDDAVADYASIASLFGRSAMESCAARVQDVQIFGKYGPTIPADGAAKLGLVPIAKADESTLGATGKPVIWIQNGTAFPLNVWMELLGQTNARGYLAWEYAEHDFEQSGDEYTYRYRWPDAIAWVNQLVAAYGESNVIATAEKVRGAQQSSTADYIMGTDLGIPGCHPDDAVYTLLAQADPAGFEKMLVAQGQAEDPSHAFSNVAALESKYGKEKVTAAINQILKSMLRSGGGTDAYSSLLKNLTRVAANDPVYLSWSKYPVGTWALYHYVWLSPPTVSPREETEFLLQLQEVAPNEVVVSRTSYYPPTDDRPNPAYFSELINVPANDPADDRGIVSHPLAPLAEHSINSTTFASQAADVTVPVGAQTFTCQVWKSSLNDGSINANEDLLNNDVPGLLVRAFNYECDGLNLGSFLDRSLMAFQRGNGTALQFQAGEHPTCPFTGWLPLPALPELPSPFITGKPESSPPPPTPPPSPPVAPAPVATSAPPPATLPAPASVPPTTSSLPPPPISPPAVVSPPAPDTPMTPLRQTTGKTTGSPQFDARILRDYDLPAGPKLPAKARDLVRLQMWKIFHAPGKLTPLQKRLLSQYCVIMELSLRH